MIQKNHRLAKLAACGALVVCAFAVSGCEQLLGLDQDARRLDPLGSNDVCDDGCDDGNPCTFDSCDVDVGMCRYTPAGDGLAPADQQTDGDCQLISCTAGEPIRTADDQDLPANTSCAIGACSDGRPTVTALERGLACGDDMFCNGEGACLQCLQDAHCVSPSTCGGAGVEGSCGCTPTTCAEVGLTCGSVSDGCYGMLACDNGVTDGAESDVDCGGAGDSCATRCETGLICAYGTDCVTGFCAGDVCDGAWSAGFGDVAVQHARAVATDAEGNAVVVGEFSGTIDFGNNQLVSPPGSWSIFVAKLSPVGAHVWSTQFGTANALPNVHDVIVDSSGSIILAGSFLGAIDFGSGMMISGTLPQAYVVKLDSLGNGLWSRRLSGGGMNSTSDATALALGPSNSVIVAGHYEGTLTVNTVSLDSVDGSDAFVARLTSAGGTDFARSFGGLQLERATDVAVSATGEIAVAGDFTGGVDFGGGAHVSKGDWDAFVVRLNDNGGYAWSRAYGDTSAQNATTIAFDTFSNVVVAGSFYGAIDLGLGPLPSAGADDVFLAKVDSNGATTWSRRYGDVQPEQAVSVVVDPRNNIVLAGSFNGVIGFGSTSLVSTGGTDVFVAKIDRDGGAIWSRRFGDAQAQVARGLAVTSSGTLLFVGDFQGAIDFGQGLLPSSGVEDVFVAALAP